MKGEELIKQIKRKQKLKTDGEVAAYLGINKVNLVHWKKPGKRLTPLQVANAIDKASRSAVERSQSNAIRPIAEFFPVNSVESRGGAKFELFPTGKDDNPLHKGLQAQLKRSKGIYVFYDTRGRAIYAGKAKRQSLWSEMTSAFNRDRETQTVYRVTHPERRQKFVPAFDLSRQPRPTKLQLNELAAYFSAFEIDEGMIANLEALVVRAFANDLLNARMERFSGVKEAASNGLRRKKKPKKK